MATCDFLQYVRENTDLETLTVGALQGQLQTQVPAGVQDPVVTGGCQVEHQPALLCCPDHTGVQQEQVRLPGEDEKIKHLKSEMNIDRQGLYEQLRNI